MVETNGGDKQEIGGVGIRTVIVSFLGKNEMLKRVQHDREKSVIPNQVLNRTRDLRFRNLEFGNGNKSIAVA